VTTVAQATAAPIEFIAKGVTYKLSPLRDRDFGDFERWCQDRYIEVTTRNLQNLSDENQKEVLRSTFDKAAAITFTSPECVKIMNSIEGSLELAFLCLKREHPSITREEVLEMCQDTTVYQQLLAKMNFLNKASRKTPVKKTAKVRKQALKKKWSK
jgi:hypothetical protein